MDQSMLNHFPLSPQPANRHLVHLLRERIEKLVKKETHLTNNAALAAVRNALLLYFLIRGIAS